MNTQKVYPADFDVRTHVFEPLGLSGAAMADPEESRRARVREAEMLRQRHAEEAQRAQETSYSQGLEAGREAALQEMGQSVVALTAAAGQLSSEFGRVREDLKHQMLQLSLAVARQVVMAELKTQPDVIGDVVRRALDEAEGRNVVAVQLHPDDADRVARLPVAHLLEQAEVEVRANDELTPGGCVVETGFGRLDARVETRLNEIADVLLGSDNPVVESDRAPLGERGGMEERQ